MRNPSPISPTAPTAPTAPKFLNSLMHWQEKCGSVMIAPG
jgi:hypothetical protein